MENFQYIRGFLQIQDLIDRAIMRTTQEDLGQNSKLNLDEFGVYTQELPDPCFTREKYDDTQFYLKAFLNGLHAKSAFSRSS